MKYFILSWFLQLVIVLDESARKPGARVGLQITHDISTARIILLASEKRALSHKIVFHQKSSDHQPALKTNAEIARSGTSEFS